MNQQKFERTKGKEFDIPSIATHDTDNPSQPAIMKGIWDWREHINRCDPNFDFREAEIDTTPETSVHNDTSKLPDTDEQSSYNR